VNDPTKTFFEIESGAKKQDREAVQNSITRVKDYLAEVGIEFVEE